MRASLGLASPIFYEPSVDELVSELRGPAADRVTVRGLATRELLGVQVRYPLGQFPTRQGMARRLVAAEGASYLAGRFDLDALKHAAPGADHSLFTPMMAYGPRLLRGLSAVVNELERDPASRRAVVALARPGEVGSAELPCTTSMQFLVREGHLHLHVAMRSWDVVLGLPVDVGAFGVVGLGVAASLNLAPGQLVVTAGSLHLYDATEHLAQGHGYARAWIDADPLLDVHRPRVRFTLLRAAMTQAVNQMRENTWTNRYLGTADA